MGGGGGGGDEKANWRDKLKSATGSTTASNLNEEETKEAMDEVEKLLRLAGEKGNGEAWNTLGDLYLVSFLYPLFLSHTTPLIPKPASQTN